jgi:hypothetical protein
MSRNFKWFPARLGVAGLVVTTVSFLTMTLAQAQDRRCAPNAGATVNLDLVRGADNDKTRAVAASSLINDWRTAMPTVMLELSKTSGPVERWRPDQVSYFLSISDVLRTTLSNNVDAITLFRACRTPEVVRPLIWAARGPSQGIRLNATLILGNIVDNTTVCFVLHHLQDPSISANGRANLLGVTLAVAGYAYLENVNAIERTFQKIESQVGAELAQTQKLMSDVLTRTKTSQNRLIPLGREGLADPCAMYPYEKPLE